MILGEHTTSSERCPLQRDSLTTYFSSIRMNSQGPIHPLALGGLKAKRDAAKAKRWVWKPFTSSARRDGARFSHWVRADSEMLDYPFSRFNKKMEVIQYSDEEYRDLLTPAPDKAADPADIDARWPRDHTDHLFDLVRRYDLRWPVIADRFELKPPHSYEDMKLRFYTVTTRVIAARMRNPNFVAPSRGIRNADSIAALAPYAGYSYKPDAEQRRRRQLDAAFRRTNESIGEERDLLRELKAVELAMKKLVGGGGKGAGARAATAAAAAAAAASSTTTTAAAPATAAAAPPPPPPIYPGSDELVQTNLALKSRHPFALGRAAAAAGADGDSSDAVAAADERLRLLRGEDPFIGVSLRSAQMTAPWDGLAPDSTTAVKVRRIRGGGAAANRCPLEPRGTRSLPHALSCRCCRSTRCCTTCSTRAARRSRRHSLRPHKAPLPQQRRRCPCSPPETRWLRCRSCGARWAS